MELALLDWLIIFMFFAISLGIGIYVSKSSGESANAFFLSGRSMPWWLLGLSMVATTFSTDTPNLVTDIVRTNGVSGNWVWWAFLITGLLTVFVYAKLWRKSNVNTDLEFYELRYGGKPASFLRKFRALYLGIIFNVITMSAVTLAAIKIGGIMLGLEPWQTVITAGLVTVTFSAIGGFKGVVYTDLILFFVAMAGAIGAAYYLVNLPEVGGVQALLTHENVIDKIAILPDFDNREALITLISTQLNWGSSYIVYDFYKRQINPEASQKRLVAVGRLSTVLLMVLSTLLALLLQNAMQLFNLLLVFGAGTGLIFILRWFWWRINAWSEITAMVASGIISLLLAIPSFGIKEALFGAEGVFPAWAEFPFVVVVTTTLWLLTTYLTPSESDSVLRDFYRKIQPGGPGWKKVIAAAQAEQIELEEEKQGWTVPSGILAMLLGCSLIYSIMFATGYYIYGNYQYALPISTLALVSGYFLIKTWKKIRVNIL
ncbi:MAG: Na+:solute symporter [Flavobacteriia bacterium]|nr:Na+:solute symporter [Flavobacteriia bacterium]